MCVGGAGPEEKELLRPLPTPLPLPPRPACLPKEPASGSVVPAGVQAPPPALRPPPEAAVCRQGEWAEAGWVTSSYPPQDATGARGLLGLGQLSPGEESPDSNFGKHEFPSLLVRNAKKETEKEIPVMAPAQARFVWRSHPARLGFSHRKVERGREEEEEAPGPISEL